MRKLRLQDKATPVQSSLQHVPGRGEKTTKEIAEMECEEVRTIQNDAKAAREDLTALIFGLDGILVRILRE